MIGTGAGEVLVVTVPSLLVTQHVSPKQNIHVGTVLANLEI